MHSPTQACATPTDGCAVAGEFTPEEPHWVHLVQHPTPVAGDWLLHFMVTNAEGELRVWATRHVPWSCAQVGGVAAVAQHALDCSRAEV